MFMLGITLLSLAGFCILIILFVGIMGWATGNRGLNIVIPMMLIIGLSISGMIIIANATEPTLETCEQKKIYYEENNSLPASDLVDYIFECLR